jgi:ribosomal protein S12 methylthiotransferase accessory factor
MAPEHVTHDPGALAWVLDWVDDRFGPLRSLGGTLLEPPDPAWWLYSCRLARTPPGTLFRHDEASAGGASTSPEEALRRTLGEAVERYSGLTSHLYADLITAPLQASELAGRLPVCALDEPCLPSFRGIAPDTLLTQVRVQRLADGVDALLPAAYVHLGFHAPTGEPPVTMPISTGLAFHPDRDHALWSGLCEVAERDAMMLMWWTRRPAPEIRCDLGDVPPPLAARLDRLRRVRLTARFFDISTDFRVPTVFCVLVSEEYPRLVAGASCRIGAASACAKALDEAVAVRRLLRHGDAPELPSLEQFDWVHRLEEHARLYADARMEHAFDFLLQPSRTITLDAFSAGPWWQEPYGHLALRDRATHLASLGLTVLWADVTAPEVAGNGHAVKVVVPEMVPLSQAHRARWLATPRLVRAAGASAASTTVMNPHPHPFA